VKKRNVRNLLLVLLAAVLLVAGMYHDRQAASAYEERTVWTPAFSPAGDAGPFFAGGFVDPAGPGRMSHVSSVAPLPGGNVAAVWYSGSREGARDVAIHYAEYDPAGLWGASRVLLTREQCAHELGRRVKKLGNPVLVSDAMDRLWLFFSSVVEGGWSMASINYKVSHDWGKTWSRSEKIVLSPFFNLTNNVKNKAVLLDDGSFLLPVYQEFIRKMSYILHVIPKDGGIRYELVRIGTRGKAIQPALLHEGGRSLLALLRNMNGGSALMSRSHDLGRTWSPIEESSLPNPNSGFDAIEIDGTGYLAVVNDSGDRSRLAIMLSADRGDTWRTVHVLEDRAGREYSYPSIVRSGNGRYHITYTYERKRIKHVTFDRAWLKEKIDRR
jgi:predicted neuraminidase